VPGKRADVIAVPGNVLMSVGALRHPLLVMKDGAVFTESSSGSRAREGGLSAQ
jgi:imidazolonepropionase-like amidohydrolase